MTGNHAPVVTAKTLDLTGGPGSEMSLLAAPSIRMAGNCRYPDLCRPVHAPIHQRQQRTTLFPNVKSSAADGLSAKVMIYKDVQAGDVFVVNMQAKE